MIVKSVKGRVCHGKAAVRNRLLPVHNYSWGWARSYNLVFGGIAMQVWMRVRHPVFHQLRGRT